MREYADKIQESKADRYSGSGGMKQAEGRRAGKVIDLVLPIIILIICCVLGMIYTGGFFSGTGFVEAFSGSDASVGLSLGSVVALIIIVIVYVARGVLGFKESMDCIPEGFKAMVAPILILTLAWTLKAMTDSLGLATFVSTAYRISCRNIHESAAGYHICYRMRSGICFRYIMGYVRYTDSYRCRSIPGTATRSS